MDDNHDNNNEEVAEDNIQEIQRHIPNEIDDVLATVMEEKLSRMKRSLDSTCCIYKVPELFRRGYEECYRPSVVSIGPAYHNDVKLQSMQRLKWNFLEAFLQDDNNRCPRLDCYINAVRELLPRIRSCYEETLLCHNDDDNTFIEMVVLDAVFLLCYFKLHLDDEPIEPYVDPPNNLSVLIISVRRDIFLEENQLPFFVLQRIVDLAYPEPPLYLEVLANVFIAQSSLYPGNFIPSDTSQIAHLIDLWRMGFSSTFSVEPRSQVKLEFPKSARQLRDAGIKFKKGDPNNPLSISFDSNSGELRIPPFFVDTRTEAFLRNILQFDQCHYWSEKQPFVNLFHFLDALIDSAEDVQILRENYILETNLFGSDEKTADLFNTITTYLDIANWSYQYSGIGKAVNAYANKRWNRYNAILLSNYFNHPWSIISVIFAIMLFILTFLQTMNSFYRK